ncbi:MAG: chromosomal replication initiator protein DnaA [Streptococcaceae bacterium]|nr:chromosomal replication initiator protein DnaA [Streptococcaceae bacterium]
MNDFISIWNQTIKYLKENKVVSDFILDLAVDKSEPIELKENNLIIKVPSFIEKDFWEKKVIAPFKMAVSITCDLEITPIPMTEDELNSYQTSETSSIPFYERQEEISQPTFAPMIPHIESNLNHEYKFKNFVQGQSNRMAFAASSAVAKMPGKMYNPLFIFGGVGLGKTHLMQGIGHAFLEDYPQARIKYVTAENFMNDYIASVRNNQMDEFRATYRTIDMLLIDDIQFLNRKGETQGEFFHTFEALTNQFKQIIITSDRTPKELDQLEDRLVSRFDKGLSVKIDPAEYETRLAILQRKVTSQTLSIPNDVLELIAGQFTSNIRELEGALMRVMAYSTMFGEDITVEKALQAIASLKPATMVKAETNVSLIQDEVAQYFGITVKDLKSKRRVKTISVPRQIAMYLCRELTNASLPAIGADFGGKDHTSVIYAQRQITKKLKTDPDLQNNIREIKSRLG